MIVWGSENNIHTDDCNDPKRNFFRDSFSHVLWKSKFDYDDDDENYKKMKKIEKYISNTLASKNYAWSRKPTGPQPLS